MKQLPSRNAAVGLSVVSALLLAGCGGGSSDAGGGVTTAPSSITSANAEIVSAQAMNSATSVSGGAGMGSSLLTGVSVDGGAVSTPGLVEASLQQLYLALNALPAGNLVAGVTVTDTAACTGGGSITVTANVADVSKMSNGDSLTVSASNCIDSGAKFNGGFTATFSNLSGTVGSASAWSATLAFRFSNFQFEQDGIASSVNGDETLTVNQTAYRTASVGATMSSLRTAVLKNGTKLADQTLSAARYSATVSGTTQTYTVDFNFTDNFKSVGSSYVVTTLSAFKQTGYAYPFQGSMKITASNNSSATVTALDAANVKIELDKNGDGAVDETVNTTWTALNSKL
jgi:hypothetical protein